MGEGSLTWSELQTVLDEMERSEGSLTPKERRFAEQAIIAGALRMGYGGEVAGYEAMGPEVGVSPEPLDVLTTDEFRALTEKLRLAANRLPAEQRTMTRDAFLQGVVTAQPEDDVRGYEEYVLHRAWPSKMSGPSIDGGSNTQPSSTSAGVSVY